MEFTRAPVIPEAPVGLVVLVCLLSCLHHTIAQMPGNQPCMNGDIRCDGRCVDKDRICDKFLDCNDGSDENNCVLTTLSQTNLVTKFPGQIPCLSKQYTCNNAQCVPMGVHNIECDGFPDCLDASDEMDVKCVGCNSTDVRCGDDTCVGMSDVCDGIMDCGDGNDEKHERCYKLCADREFKCTGFNQCIGIDKTCDGVVDCVDGSDEGAETCATCPFNKNISCVSGNQCYSEDDKCDGKHHCIDMSDEAHCEACKGDTSMCKADKRCLIKSQLCDNIKDCSDGSDEMDCECPLNWHRCTHAHCIPKSYVCDGNNDCPLADDEDKEMCKKECGAGKYQCEGGHCIGREAICDGVEDCPNEEDEHFTFCRQVAKCEDNEMLFKCKNSDTCIFREWMCDGHVDCVGEEDEEEEMCRDVKCKEDYIKCPNEMKCIHVDDECDGREDCLDGSDELGCAIPTKLIGREETDVFVNHNGTYYPLCADNMCPNQKFICNYLAISHDRFPLMIAEMDTSKVLYFKGNYTYYSLKNINSHLVVKDKCQHGHYKLNCSQSLKYCGMKKEEKRMIVPNIVNGFEAMKGEWPWYVLLKFHGGKMCGGSLVSHNMILTSADCVSRKGKKIDPSMIQAIAGSCLRSGNMGTKLKIKEVHVNPYYEWHSGIYDVAMLEVMEPVTFSDTISPVCMPDALEEMKYKRCHIVGFGKTRENGFMSNNLLHARVNLMTQKECIISLNSTKPISNFQVLNYVDYTHRLCAGLANSHYGSNICEGDYGGPLVCETMGGTWQQVGVAETSPDDPYCKSSIFTKVKANLDFIHSHINMM